MCSSESKACSYRYSYSDILLFMCVLCMCVCMFAFVGSCLAIKVLIGNLLANREGGGSS